MNSIIVYVDGGSLGNGQPDSRGYGSAQVWYKEKMRRQLDFKFKDGTTSVEAEWMSLIEVLKYLTDMIAGKSNLPPIIIRCDNRQVIRTMLGKMKTRAEHLKPLSDECQLWLIGKEDDVTFERVPDTLIKSILGH
ncbi:MAG: hypothetical protein KAI86_10250 [Desulfobacterales bacterium]|nr:hypothetical protein [Desulfobacterales bacterium]